MNTDQLYPFWYRICVLVHRAGYFTEYDRAWLIDEHLCECHLLPFAVGTFIRVSVEDPFCPSLFKPAHTRRDHRHTDRQLLGKLQTG